MLTENQKRDIIGIAVILFVFFIALFVVVRPVWIEEERAERLRVLELEGGRYDRF